MPSNLIGARVQFYISDPWDLATTNGELFRGEIVKVFAGTSEVSESLCIKLDTAIASEKIRCDEFIARIRHEGKSAADLLLDEMVAFNFSNEGHASSSSTLIRFIAGMELADINS